MVSFLIFHFFSDSKLATDFKIQNVFPTAVFNVKGRQCVCTSVASLANWCEYFAHMILTLQYKEHSCMHNKSQNIIGTMDFLGIQITLSSPNKFTEE